MLFCCLFLGHLCLAASYPALPPMFATAKGQAIANGKVVAISDKGVKILHDGGISVITAGDLPGSVSAALGLQPEATLATVLTLPNPLNAGGKVYQAAELIAIDPDGIRIRHLEGLATIRYELLSPDLQKACGGFDPQAATSFRASKEQQDLAARAEIERQRMAALSPSSPPPETSGATAAGAPTRPAAADPLSDPNYISPNVTLTLTAMSTGGKNRNEPWKTDYGSYNRVDTSKRQIVCTLENVSRDGVQRARVQAFMIVRSYDTGEARADLVEDCLVTVAAGRRVSVGAFISATNTDDKYVALGIRERTGDKYLGWTWRVLDGLGRISAVRSSQSGYDHYAREQPVR